MFMFKYTHFFVPVILFELNDVFAWAALPLCVQICVFRKFMKQREEVSGPVHGSGEALGSTTAAVQASSQIAEAKFRTSLIFPHRSRSFAATLQCHLKKHPEQRETSPSLSKACLSMFISVFSSSIQAVTCNLPHISFYNNLSKQQQQHKSSHAVGRSANTGALLSFLWF